MASSNVTVRIKFGSPRDVTGVEAQLRAQLVLRAAEATKDRTAARLRANGHPTGRAIAAGLRAVPVNQWSASVVGSRGGPGIIRPIRYRGGGDSGSGPRALYWRGARHPVARVNGRGIGPLIEAEGRRVDKIDTTGIEIR